MKATYSITSLRVFPLLALFCVGGCNIATDPLGIGGGLKSISISGPSRVAVGDSVSLSTWGEVSGLLGIFTYDRVLDAAWTTSDQTVVSIRPIVPPASDTTTPASTWVRGLRPGSVEITVSARGFSAKQTVTVVPPAAAP